MADTLTPEQIAELAESLSLYKRAQDGAKDSTEKLKDAQEQFGKNLGKTAADLGSSLYKGEKGVGQFGNAAESAAKALQNLILDIPGIGLAMKVLAVTIGTVGKAFNAAAKQGDALFKTYQDLGRAGATASDGITGVFRNMQNFGYGIEELDKMVQLVTQNSETLAQFSLTAADGTNAFAEGMAQIQRDGGLRLLGKTTDDINSAGAAFIRQQVLMGRRQSDMQGDLGARTKAYVLELDRLQRLTGTSADVLQKKQEELMQEDAYLVYLEMLEEQGEEGRKQAEKIREVTSNLEPEYAKMVARAIGGNVEAQQQLAFLMPNLIKDLRDPAKSYADIMKTAGQDITKFKGVFRENYLLDPSMAEFGSKMSSINKQLARTKDTDLRDQAARENAEVLDDNTKRLAEAQIANMNSRDAMQAFIQKGVAPATVALNAMAKAASGAAGAAAGAVGAKPGGAAAGSAPGMGQMDYKKELYGIGGGGVGGAAGLKLKSGAEKMGSSTEKLYSMAQQVHKMLGGDYKYFSGLKDRGIDSGGAHPQGRAFDLVLNDPSKYADVVAQMRALGGFSQVLDESQGPANPAQRDKWAPHIHAEVSAANGAILSGPMSGYRPNLTMHGTEAIVPLNKSTAQAAFSGFDPSDLMSQQLDKLDELVRVMQNQVSVSTKILQSTN